MKDEGGVVPENGYRSICGQAAIATMDLSVLRTGGFHFVGMSRGSGRTSIHVKPGNFLLDIGFCGDRAIRVPNVLVTHGHLDHINDLMYYIGQRKLMRMGVPHIYIPEKIHDRLMRMIGIWSELEQVDFPYVLHPLHPGDVFALQGDLFGKAMQMVHRVECLGYAVGRSRKKLRSEYLGMSGTEIVDLKKRLGESIFHVEDEYLLFFSGDTTLQCFSIGDPAYHSRIRFQECTFIDHRRDAEHAGKWGHTHLDDIVRHAELFAVNETIVLYHFSRRYTRSYIEKTIRRKLPSDISNKVVVFV